MFEAAIIQTTPKINWGQRDSSAEPRPADVFAVDDIVVCPPYKLIPVRCRTYAKRIR